MPRSRKSTGGTSAASASSSKSSSSSSVIEQLQMLRACVGTGSVYSETDLSTCLREAGYSVDLAAERLLTGQYQPRAKRAKIASSPFFQRKKTQPLSAVSTSAAASSTPPSTTSSSTTTSSTPVNNNNNNKKTPPHKASPKQRQTPSSSSSAAAANKSSSSSTAVATPKTNPSQVDIDEQWWQDCMSPKVPIKRDESNDWLLCQRWVSDGVCTQRNASLRYQEILDLLPSKDLLKFRGYNSQGQLPKHLNQFLLPLLLVSSVSSLSVENDADNNCPLIRIQASALAEDRRLPVGAQVPLNLSIFIPNPRAFFAIFHNTNSETVLSSKLFLNSKVAASPKNKSSSSSSPRYHHNHPSSDVLARAAFQLLQWAQYGDAMPVFDTPSSKVATAKTNNDGEDSNGSDQEEEEEILLEDNDDGAPTGDEDVAPEMAQLETNYSRRDGDDNNNTTINLQETDAPPDFKAHLRPYQRQALWWMMQRERQEEQAEWSQQRLELLKDLQQQQQQSTTIEMQHHHQQQHSLPSAETPIRCDECGPVLVNPAHVAAPPVEGGDSSSSTTTTDHHDHHHPLWERRYLASPDRQRALSFYVQPLFGMASPSLPPPPQPCRGGILADSMGLGKTVMLLALIQHHPGTTTLVVTPLSLLAQWEEELTSKTTLSYRVHYGDNKKRNNDDDFGAVNVVLTTYGTLQGELQSHNKKQSLLNKKAASPPLTGLLGHSWTRVILDEAHCIKNTNTVASRACCLLRAERRWCVSGTIIQNSLDDVFALLKFLRHEPWCEAPFWKAAISKIITSNNSNNNNSEEEKEKQNDRVAIALDRVRRVLLPILLRRTKDSVDEEGNRILKLPPKDTKTIMVSFSPAERQFYDALHRKSLDLFEGFIRAGTASKSWLTIFSLLHRLRQTCDHVALTIKAHQDQGEWDSQIAASQQEETKEEEDPVIKEPPSGAIDQRFLDDLMKKFRQMESKTSRGDTKKSGDESYASSIANMLNNAVQKKNSALEEECSICLEVINIRESVVTPCFHIFCKDCLVGVLKGRPTSSQSQNTTGTGKTVCPNGPCPVCTEEIDSSKILRISDDCEGGIKTSYLLRPETPAEFSPQVEEEDGAAREALESAVQGASSAKLAAVLEELDNVWKEDPGSKVLIFSQFLGFLDLIGQACKSNKIPTSRLDGKLSLKERMTVLQHFGSSNKRVPVGNAGSDEGSNTDRVGSVLLISMKAGGVGLNLVAASTVFIVDPWWNAAVEDQCVDRIHRIGQTAEKVRIRKFCVRDSVEERILQLQKRKKDMASQVLCDKGGVGVAGAGSRPTMDDLKILFGT